jgi:hypothetical protein
LEGYFSFCIGATRFGEPVSSLQNDLLKNEAGKTFSHGLGQVRRCWPAPPTVRFEGFRTPATGVR